MCRQVANTWADPQMNPRVIAQPSGKDNYGSAKGCASVTVLVARSMNSSPVTVTMKTDPRIRIRESLRKRCEAPPSFCAAISQFPEQKDSAEAAAQERWKLLFTNQLTPQNLSIY